MLLSSPKTYFYALHSHSSSLFPYFYSISSITISLNFRIYYHSHTPPPCFFNG
ncbi:hypothetical protein RchiOBHm_Chr4g0397701 [Rosa chinensis]|uniref:Uncharacterized protein n=1 Tax=Rosa chinensis TaxID=74649 RepID=A0A2P6QS63_ROSCH|nr:hypothetical protein RchiOBHm_Chr4g0397701 [Rosa chinensis]